MSIRKCLVPRGRYRYDSKLNVGALLEVEDGSNRRFVSGSITFALSTIGVNGTGRGTGDCGFN